MGKISQDSAHRAAVEVSKKIDKKRIEILKELQKEVTEIYKASIPAEIMKLWAKYPDWMDDAVEVRLEGYGFNSYGVTMTARFPTNQSNYYNRKINLTKEQGTKLWKMDVKMQELEKKYNDTVKEIEAAILSLGTDARVKEQLPEVYPYLPGRPVNTQVAVQLQPVREKVQCLVSKDTKCMEKI